MLRQKDHGGRTRALQDRQIAFMQKLGFEVHVIDNEEKLKNFIDRIGDDNKWFSNHMNTRNTVLVDV